MTDPISPLCSGPALRASAMAPRRALAISASALTLALALVALPFRAQAQQTPPSAAPQDFSVAERALFMSDQLGNVTAASTLRYAYRRKGTLEAPFEDRVELQVKPTKPCCAAEVRFLSAERKLELPPQDQAAGNPVLLHFLERDVREMNRLTKGAQAYYRKRLRMAIYNNARVRDITLGYKGKPVRGKRIEIAPFDDDPARSRYTQHASKTYQFDLSEDVPGGIHSLRSLMLDGKDASKTMIDEELVLDGATPTP